MNRARLATFFLPYLLLGTTLGAHIPAYGCDEDPIVTSCSQALKEGVSAFEHRDYAVAMASLLPLAEAGVPRAQTVLGRMYLRGQGVPPDSHRALTLFRKAADQGLRNAQNNLAGMYAAGKGVPQDYQEAIKWFRKAADQDYALATDNLASMYQAGFGVRPDKVEADKWRQRARSLGFTGSEDTVHVQTVGTREYKKGLDFYHQWQFAQAAEFFLQGAEKGHPEAQFENRVNVSKRTRRSKRRC